MTTVTTTAAAESPYRSYVYAYPHKTAYRPLPGRPLLRELWAGEPQHALSLYLHVPFCEVRCGFCNLFTRIGSPEGLTPLQQSFLECAALQCGICTPGFIVAAHALLEKNPHPTEHEIRFWLAGNLCRCTGYDKIIRAVQQAANGKK